MSENDSNKHMISVYYCRSHSFSIYIYIRSRAETITNRDTFWCSKRDKNKKDESVFLKKANVV
jgi:hypothetical protein